MTNPSLPTLMLEPLVRAALLEDLGRAGDITTDAVVPAQARAETALVVRQPGVVAVRLTRGVAKSPLAVPPPRGP